MLRCSGVKYLFLKQAEAYVKRLEKSNLGNLIGSWTPGGKRVNVVLKVLCVVKGGEPPGTRSQGPRLKARIDRFYKCS